MDRLVWLGKYLAAHPKYILHFVKQKDVHALNGYDDNDFVGEIPDSTENVGRNGLP